MMDQPIVYIVYERVFSLDGSELEVGGVQTYLLNLAQVVLELGWRPIIVQHGTTDFEKNIDRITIRGRAVPGKIPAYRQLYETFKSDIKHGRDIVVWGTFQKSPDIKELKSVTIQHGIGFDMIFQAKYFKNFLYRSFVQFGSGKLYKMLQRHQAQSWFNRSGHKVCVDYNFLNWHRTYSLRKDDATITVIPNFTEIPQIELGAKDKFRRIVFARRFSYERGATLMINAARELMNKYSDVSITFAGKGPLRSEIQNLQQQYPDRVEITEYEPDQSVEFHRNFDIAVVPSLGSEGTSLSALEAMAAGCVLVCSNVGGLTNIVIDEFNGLLVTPLQDPLIKAIESIINSSELGNRLRKNGRETVVQGFSRERWAERWKRVFTKL